MPLQSRSVPECAKSSESGIIVVNNNSKVNMRLPPPVYFPIVQMIPFSSHGQWYQCMINQPSAPRPPISQNQKVSCKRTEDEVSSSRSRRRRHIKSEPRMKNPTLPLLVIDSSPTFKVREVVAHLIPASENAKPLRRPGLRLTHRHLLIHSHIAHRIRPSHRRIGIPTHLVF